MNSPKNLDASATRLITGSYLASAARLIFLDYDGTLVPFAPDPHKALPPPEVLALLETLASSDENTVVIISGRDRRFLEKIFGSMNLTLVAEHGFFIRRPRMPWVSGQVPPGRWKTGVLNLMLRYNGFFPGALLEEKETSLAWHYRNCPVAPTSFQLSALTHMIMQIIGNSEAVLLQGNKVIEVRAKNIDKGTVARMLTMETDPGFILAAGDDRTDEDLFGVLPESAFTIKVGYGTSVAKYICNETGGMIALLQHLAVAEPQKNRVT